MNPFQNGMLFLRIIIWVVETLFSVTTYNAYSNCTCLWLYSFSSTSAYLLMYKKGKVAMALKIYIFWLLMLQ